MKKLIERFFGPSYKLMVTFHLKSGTKVDVPCDDIKIKHEGGRLIEYNMEGCATNLAFYIRLDDISAITYRKH